MVATLKKSGVTQIDGNVLIDTSIFASHDKAPLAVERPDAVFQRASRRRHC